MLLCGLDDTDALSDGKKKKLFIVLFRCIKKYEQTSESVWVESTRLEKIWKNTEKNLLK